ncbi:MAG TPA: hypothetical protein VHM91_02230 [Verrucomicrobiales bacterium]|nr:hypothetical protein [Verrucomicrobiales bacterium]
MSPEIIPLPQPPPAQPANITPMPAPPPLPAEEDAWSKLKKNPLLLAGGAMLAGMALTRLFATPSVRKLAQDLAQEAMKRAKSSTAEETTPPVASLLEQGVEALRPQVTEAAKSFLAAILKKP